MARRIGRARVGLGAAIAALLVSGSSGGFAAAGDIDDIPIQVPMVDPSGRSWNLPGRLCRPRSVNPPRLAVVNHGSALGASDLRGMQPESCGSAPAVWFLRHGFAVAFVLRLGYGNVDSPWTESFHCTAEGFYAAGLETARQIRVIVDSVSRRPDLAADGIVVVGHSAGGWGSIAFDTLPHPNVAAIINMAGGRGGHFQNRPDNNCHPEHLIEAARRFGKIATTPMLWIYARNDSFFGPVLAQRLNDAFVGAGGKTQFVQTPAFNDDGHALFFQRDGSAIWGPLFEAYLIDRHVLQANTHTPRPYCSVAQNCKVVRPNSALRTRIQPKWQM